MEANGSSLIRQTQPYLHEPPEPESDSESDTDCVQPRSSVSRASGKTTEANALNVFIPIQQKGRVYANDYFTPAP